MRQDLWYALRTLRRAPAFSLVAVLTLLLAVGSTTAVFSVVDSIVLHGLPYRDASRLQLVFERSEDGNNRVPSFPTFRDWQLQGAAVNDAIEGFAFVRGDGVKIGDNPDRQITAYVTPGFFQLMGTAPLLGRGFLTDEEKLGGPRVAVASYDFFMRKYGGDRAIIGKVIAVDSVPTTIIGVMPRGFAFPNFGSGGWLPPAIWQPISVFQATHTALSLRGLHVDSRTILRLRAGTDSARAATAMRTIAQRLAAEYPQDQGHWTSVSLIGLADGLFGNLWSTLLLIAGAIGLVLLLACANVANLMLVRSSARRQEFAVRAALGASRLQIGRLLFIESAVIAVAAGTLGTALAAVLVGLTRPFAAQRLPFATDIAVDPRAVLFAIGLTTATALLVGALPALQASRGNLVQRLRGGAAAASGGIAEFRVRNGLVSVQFALAITLLIGAGLLIQSVRRVGSVPLGYDPNDVISFAIAPPAHKYDTPAQAAALYRRMLDASHAVPSVEATAAAGGALLSTKVEIEGRSGSAAPPTALYHPISDDFLRILHIPVVAGRGFTADDMRSPSGFLVSENLAKQLWPQRSAIGQRITVYRSSQARADFGQPITLPVIGVVGDYREHGPEQKPPAQVFLPYTLEVWPWMNFIVRARAATSVLAPLERAVKDVEPAITFFAKPSIDRGGQLPSLADPRFFVTSLLSAFSALALLLAAIGLYGVVAYGVAQRTREIGIRIAIGAPARSIVTLLLRQAMTFVLAGVGAGLLAAGAATKLLQAMLFETATTDVTTFVVVPIVLAFVAIAASCLPAYRATRTDPAIVIRAE